MPFLAVAGGHGVVQSLSAFEGGVGIWMRGMREVKVLEGGETARIEGGALSGEVVRTLWEDGKMAGEFVCFGFMSMILDVIGSNVTRFSDGSMRMYGCCCSHARRWPRLAARSLRSSR